MKKASLYLSAFASAGIAEPAFAKDREQIIVTAGRTGDAINTLGGTAIEGDTIEVLQPISTLDVLDRAPGVRAFEKGGPGGPSYLSIRGGEPNFTLVLLDGLRVNDPTNSRGGAFDFSQIDPTTLERIEIAKGAFSAVHGADALSGVVNLRFRNFEEGERLLAGRAFADTRGGLGASASAGTGWSAGSLLASASWTDSGDLSEGSDLDRWQAFGRAQQTLGPVALSAFGLHARSDRSVFPEDSGGPRLAVIREREQRETELTVLGFNALGAGAGWWQPRLSAGWVRQDDRALTPAIAPGPVISGVPALAADSRFERVELTFANAIELDENAEVVVGASWLREKGEATGSIDFGFLIPADFTIDREMIGVFAETTVRPAPWALLTAGLRFDDPSSRSGEWTGRVGARIEPLSGGPALIASWSEGYKLPSLYALAYPIIANPDLKPERSESYEIGLEQRLGGGEGRARVTWFHSRYTDLIDFDPEAFTNVNRTRVTAQGVEAELSVPLSPNLDLAANLTYLDTDQPDDAAPLRSRPEWQGLAALDWRPTRRLGFYLSASYLSDFFDSSVPTGLVTLDGHTDVTAAATYRFNDMVQATLTARNILGGRYEEAVGFPAPGRVVRLSVSVRR